MSETETKQTTNHEEIRNWVEHRNGNPAMVQGTENGGGGGLLRIDFEAGDTDDDPLEHLSWDDFFEAFEDEDLAFVYQERTEDGSVSRFCRLVSREE